MSGHFGTLKNILRQFRFLHAQNAIESKIELKATSLPVKCDIFQGQSFIDLKSWKTFLAF